MRLIKKICKTAALVAVPVALLAGCAEKLDDTGLGFEKKALQLGSAVTIDNASALTRSVAGKDSWTGGEEFGVKLVPQSGNAEESYGRYKIDASGNITYVAAAYWQEEGESVLSAWYPNSLAPMIYTIPSTMEMDISDQSTPEKFAACDFLVANATVTYGSVPTVTFTHALAKLRIDVAIASSAAFAVDSVLINGFYEVELNDELTAVESSGRRQGIIRPCEDADGTGYEAMLPQDRDVTFYVYTSDKKRHSFSVSGDLMKAGETTNFTARLGYDNYTMIVLDTLGNSQVTPQDYETIEGSTHYILTGSTDLRVMIGSGVTEVVLLNAKINNQLELKSPATLTLTGTNVVSTTGKDKSAILFSVDGTLTIDGMGGDVLEATATGFNSCGIEAGGKNSNIVIKNGSITAKGGSDGAGIGSGSVVGGEISITGGTIKATGGSDGVGIGAGGNYCPKVSISGGNVTATGGGFGAGIGSSGTLICDEVSITGGTVKATGGSKGAGIGSKFSNIYISGGTVTAQGGSFAAGIGSNTMEECGKITISGGEVTSQGGEGAAGIGSGGVDPDILYNNSCEGVIISGGTVTATGGIYGAGIGTGTGLKVNRIPGLAEGDEKEYISTCKTVTVSGGKVIARGGRYGTGIGTGEDYATCETIIIKNSGTTVEVLGTTTEIGRASGDNLICNSIQISPSAKITRIGGGVVDYNPKPGTATDD